MTENKQALMLELKKAIARLCFDIEAVARDYGLPLSRITVVARDPLNDEMYVAVTNETDEGIKRACALALKKPAATVKD